MDRYDECSGAHALRAEQQADAAGSGSASPSTTIRRRPIVEAAQWVHSELDYVPGTTGVHSSGLDALARGQGRLPGLRASDADPVAQHGNSGAIRVGLSASERGKAKVGDTIDGQSHAWIQAWTGGWWNYDPTNDNDDQRAVHQRRRRP